MLAPAPVLLAFDTSTEVMALALRWPGGELTRVEPGGALASGRLIAALQALVQQAGLSLRQIDAIAFGAGPGAFTGLRCACAVAQGLGFGLGRPLLALDSLMLVAEDAAAQVSSVSGLSATPASACPPTPLWVAMDARMDEVYAAAYTPHLDGWRVHVAPALYTLAALAARWHVQPPSRIAGSAITAFGARLPVGQAHCVPGEYNRGAALTRVAAMAWSQGQAIAARQALPIYLRDQVALTSQERAQERAGRARAAAVKPAPQ